jgi:potassium efflux system protein
LWFAWNPEWKDVLNLVSSWKCAFIAGLLILAVPAYVWVRRRAVTASFAGFLAGSPGRTLLKTAFLAAGVPIVLLCLAALFDSPGSPALGRALHAGFTEAGYLLFPLMFIWWAMADEGMAERHFGWSAAARKIVRGELRWLRVALPLSWFFVAALTEVGSILSGDPFLQASKNSLGLFAYTAAMMCTFVAAIRVLHPAGAFASEIRGRSRPGLGLRLAARRAVLVFVLLLFVGIAAAGFFTTALILARNAFWTVCLTGVVTLASWLMVRWRENRARLLLDGANVTSSRDTDEAQVRQLGRFGLTALWTVAALAIWSNIFPALARLDQVEIMPATTAVQTQSQPSPAQGAVKAPQPPAADSRSDRGSASGPLTLLDVLKAILAAIILVILVKNVPGLLHFAVLNRFRLDAGAIYAASTIARYFVIMIGLGVISGILGIRWSQVQWLAAALTFGIGFGLQEIFANFASGLILLFDRSIRVGDAVSLGEFSGRVSRIQMRATTVTLWNRSEMIVPNKEFMSSKLVNWTSSLPETRVDVKVGVAYGSDLDLVRKVLYRIAASNPNVLKTPDPQVLLTAFADSSVNFELRVFCLYAFGGLVLLDQLHTAVYREFSDQGISIAYPRLDVHVQHEDVGLSRRSSSVANR